MDKRIQVIAYLAGIALFVTVVLYLLFENNLSSFQNATKTIKLGGSVAFFFVLFTTEFAFMKQIYCDNLSSIRKELSGKWKCVSEIKNKENNEIVTYRGTARG